MQNEISLMKTNDTVLLIIDVQEKLINSIKNKDTMIKNCIKLISASKILGVEIIFTEQNPSRLGKTLEDLRIDSNDKIFTKMSFSCCQCKDLINMFKRNRIRNILISGIETHVCVQQTSIELIGMGFRPFVTVDAISSRNLIDHNVAIKRLENSGIVLTSTEACIFELCKTSDRKEFKQISKLIKS